MLSLKGMCEEAALESLQVLWGVDISQFGRFIDAFVGPDPSYGQGVVEEDFDELMGASFQGLFDGWEAGPLVCGAQRMRPSILGARDCRVEALGERNQTF